MCPPKLSDYGITIEDVLAQFQRHAAWAAQWRQMVQFAELVHQSELQEYESKRTKGTGRVIAGMILCGVTFWAFMFMGVRSKDTSFLWIGGVLFLVGIVLLVRTNEQTLAANHASLPPRPEFELPLPPSLDVDPRVHDYCVRLIEYSKVTGKSPELIV